MDNFLARGRYRLGRWLLKPKSRQIVSHYQIAAQTNEADGKLEEARNCVYMKMGATYVGWYGSHG